MSLARRAQAPLSPSAVCQRSYLNFLSLDLSKIREDKNSARTPFGLLFEIDLNHQSSLHPPRHTDAIRLTKPATTLSESSLDVCGPSSVSSSPESSIQDLPLRKRRKLDQPTSIPSPERASLEPRGMTWQMYQDSDSDTTSIMRLNLHNPQIHETPMEHDVVDDDEPEQFGKENAVTQLVEGSGKEDWDKDSNNQPPSSPTANLPGCEALRH